MTKREFWNEILGRDRGRYTESWGLLLTPACARQVMYLTQVVFSLVCSQVILWATYQNFRRVCCMPSPVLGAGIPEMDIYGILLLRWEQGGPEN